MLENLPIYISILFALTTVATLLLFYWTIKNSSSVAIQNKANIIMVGLIIWLVLQMILSLKSVYNADTTAFPPKIMLLGILPTILTIVFLFVTNTGRAFIDSLPLKNITYINTIRIPVEIVLFCLFMNRAVPQLMTFDGRNFDVISGITAPLVAYFGLTKRLLSRKIILLWNLVCLALLINIVVNALLSAPTPLQKFGFDQPNIAILNFPFSWLPTFIVPIILLGHLVSIRQLVKRTIE